MQIRGTFYEYIIFYLSEFIVFLKWMTWQLAETEKTKRSLDKDMLAVCKHHSDMTSSEALINRDGQKFKIWTGRFVHSNFSSAETIKIETIGQRLKPVIENLTSYEECTALLFNKQNPTHFFGNFTSVFSKVFITLFLGGSENESLIRTLFNKISEILSSESPENRKKWQELWTTPHGSCYCHPLIAILLPRLFSLAFKQELAQIFLNLGCAPPEDKSEFAKLLRSCAASLGVGRNAEGQACLYPEELKHEEFHEEISPLCLAMAHLWRDDSQHSPAEEVKILRYLQGKGYRLCSTVQDVLYSPWAVFLEAQLVDPMLIQRGIRAPEVELLLCQIVESLVDAKNSEEQHRAAFEVALEQRKQALKKEDIRHRKAAEILENYHTAKRLPSSCA